MIVIDWSLSLRALHDVGRDATYCPKVTGPRGGRKAIYDCMYHDGTFPPNYPVPAIPYKVCFYASGDSIEIRSFKGVGSKRSYIDKVFWKPV